MYYRTWELFLKDNLHKLLLSYVIHSFIHIEHLYSASSRKLLRSAPNTSTVKQSSLVIDKTEILTFYSRDFIKFNIFSFAKSLLALHHNIIHLRFCKTGYASPFGVGLHNIELNIEIYHPQSSK